MADAPPPNSARGWAPVPDPTVLTTEALQREIKGLGEILRAEVKIAVADAEGNQAAILIRVGSVEQTIQTLETEIKERLNRVEAQRIEHKLDTQKATADALAAQKELSSFTITAFKQAADKSEEATGRQIAQQSATVSAQLGALSDKLADITSRVGTIEAVKLGGQEFKGGAQMNLGMIISVLAIIIVIINFFASRTP